MSSRLTRSTRVAIAGAILACAAPAVASAANTVAVPATPINTPLTTTYASSTVTVRSVLTTPQEGLTFKVIAPKGVDVVIMGAKGARTTTLPTLDAKASTTVDLRIRRSAKGPKMPTITLKVLKKHRVVGSGRVVIRKAAKPTTPPAKKTPVKKAPATKTPVKRPSPNAAPQATA